MRFRANVTNVALFLRLCGALGKIEKNCVLQLAPRSVRFVLTTAMSDGMELWAGMNADTLFDAVVIDSLAPDKSITLKVALDALDKALRSGQAAQRFTVRLKKHAGMPVLSFFAEVQSPFPVAVCQDVPVTVLPSSFMRGVTEPALPNPDVYIYLPPVKALHSAVEHLRNVAENAVLSATMNGEFSIGVDTTTAAVVATFSGLQRPDVSLPSSAAQPEGGGSGGVSSSSNSSGEATPVSGDAAGSQQCRHARAKVSIAKLHRFLQCHQVQPNNVICCIVEGRSVVFHAVLDDLYMTYYLPVLVS